MHIVVYLQPRQNLLAAASRVGEASHDVMDGVGGETVEDMDKAYQVGDIYSPVNVGVPFGKILHLSLQFL